MFNFSSQKGYFPILNYTVIDFIKYCEDGNLTKIKKIFQDKVSNEKFKDYRHSLIDGIEIAIKNNNNELFNYLVWNIPLTEQREVDDVIKCIVKRERIEMFKELLKLYKNEINLIMSSTNILVLAIENNKLEFLRYIIKTKDCNNPDLHADYERALRVACSSENLDILRFILLSDDMGKKPNIHIKNDECLIWSYKLGKLNTVNFLIHEYKIDYTEEIYNFMNEDENFKKICLERNYAKL